MSENQNQNQNQILTKYIASIYLAMIGDKIGFGNGHREKNYLDEPIVVDGNPGYESFAEGISNIMIFRFISEGSLTGLNFNDLKVSDDTEMHICTINGLISDFTDRNKLYSLIADLYVDVFKDVAYARDVLLAGRQTLDSLKKISDGVNWKHFAYNKHAGGSGGPMRTMALGLAFYQTNNLLKLIESSIMICSITHPNPTAFIGSIASALFTAYGIRGLNLETWIFELINLLEGNVIDDIVEKIKPNFIEYFKEDKKLFLHKLLTYVETSFDNYNYIITTKHIRSIYSWKRIKYYFDNFATNKRVISPGAGADDCIIIAYDCLLMSRNNYEKLVYMSMINIGDSDTVGSIASAWYGALYGFENVGANILSESILEYNNICIKAQELYDKYYDKNIENF